MNGIYTQLINNLEYLKIKQMIIHLDEVINFTMKNNLSFVDALIRLTANETDYKEANMVKSMVKSGFSESKRNQSF